MTVYFADTSALARRYVAEIGSRWVQEILDPSSGNIVVIVRVTAAEMIAALTRRERGGSLTPADAAVARAEFRSHLDVDYQVVEVDEPLVDRAMALAEVHALRGYDAIQLSAALTVNRLYTTAGFPPITLLSADAELNNAARAEGLVCDDPNLHS